MSEARKESAYGRAGDDSAQIHMHLNEKKERLQDELANLLFGTPEDELDYNALDALLDELEAAESALGIPNTEESFERFQQKYGTVISSVETKPAAISRPSQAEKHFRHTFFKFIPVAAALILLLGSMSAQAFGLDIFGAIAHWTSEIFQLGGSSTPYAEVTKMPLAEGEEATYDSLQDALNAFGIIVPVAPKWVPERFALISVTAANQPGGAYVYADYEGENGYFQIRYKETHDFNFTSLEKEDSSVEAYWRRGIKHYFLSDLDRQKAFWKNGELECCMAGTVSKQEMEEIIDSIYEGE